MTPTVIETRKGSKLQSNHQKYLLFRRSASTDQDRRVASEVRLLTSNRLLVISSRLRPMFLLRIFAAYKVL